MPDRPVLNNMDVVTLQEWVDRCHRRQVHYAGCIHCTLQRLIDAYKILAYESGE